MRQRWNHAIARDQDVINIEEEDLNTVATLVEEH